MLSIAAQFWELSLKNNFFCSKILYGEQIDYVICFKQSIYSSHCFSYI